MGKRLVIFWGMIMVLLGCLTGCGKEEVEEEYLDIYIEEEKPDYGIEGANENYICLGAQFYQGEKVQIWGERKSAGGGVYLHREDGTRELLVEDVDEYFISEIGTYEWWLDGEGRCFVIGDEEIIRVDRDEGLRPDREKGLGPDYRYYEYEGAVFRQKKLIRGICQLEDVRIIVAAYEGGGFNWTLYEMDPDTGNLEEIQKLEAAANELDLIAAGGNGLILLNRNGVWDFNLADGTKSSILSFNRTSYTLKEDRTGLDRLVKEDFRMREDGRAEILWSDGKAEILSLQPVSEDREVIVLRGSNVDSWMKEQATRFNQRNEKYHVVIEERGDSDYDAFVEKTAMDLGAGRGADIVKDNLNDTNGLLEKGVFEDLTPYMEASGIREEDYFPSTFSGRRYEGGIYGVSCMCLMDGFFMVKEVADGADSVEELVDKLLAYHEDAVFIERWGAESVLNYFLESSESLCRMVDLENGTCDFGGELFGKMLEAAKRYGKDERRQDRKVLADDQCYSDYKTFNDSGYLEENGLVPIGYLFDDGGHTRVYDTQMMAINSSSGKKEGAWEFISFLLGEEAQESLYGASRYSKPYPAKKSAFETAWALAAKSQGTVDEWLVDTGGLLGMRQTKLTEYRKDELRAALEDARMLPVQTRPLVQIILEEAAAYFNGDKSVDEVRAVVENRVRLYLEEKK